MRKIKDYVVSEENVIIDTKGVEITQADFDNMLEQERASGKRPDTVNNVNSECITEPGFYYWEGVSVESGNDVWRKAKEHYENAEIEVAGINTSDVVFSPALVGYDGVERHWIASRDICGKDIEAAKKANADNVLGVNIKYVSAAGRYYLVGYDVDTLCEVWALAKEEHSIYEVHKSPFEAKMLTEGRNRLMEEYRTRIKRQRNNSAVQMLGGVI